MSLRTWYTIHKWLWVFTGVFLLGWLVSGMLMLIPQPLIGAHPQVPPVAVPYRQVTISPAQAIDITEGLSGSKVSASRVIFRSVHNRPLYAVQFNAAPEIVLDAISGELFSMSPEFAKTIVAYNFPEADLALTVTKLNRHSMAYPFGPLPVFHIASQGNSSTAYLVNITDGRAFRSTNLTRLRGALISLHDFSTLKLITEDRRVREVLLLIAAATGLIGTLIGYYMALPHRRRD